MFKVSVILCRCVGSLTDPKLFTVMVPKSYTSLTRRGYDDRIQTIKEDFTLYIDDTLGH